MSISGKTLTIKGAFRKAKNWDKLFTDYTTLSYKTRKFKLTKNCRYCYTGGDYEDVPQTQSELMQYATQYSGLSLTLYTNRRGKVYKMELRS